MHQRGILLYIIQIQTIVSSRQLLDFEQPRSRLVCHLVILADVSQTLFPFLAGTDMYLNQHEPIKIPQESPQICTR